MKDRRLYERLRTFLGASIIFNNKNSSLECQIRNISPAGAKLVLSETVALPEEFDVCVPHKGRTFRSFLRWRSPHGVGVEFLRNDARSVPAAGDALSARVRELESENELLLKHLLELMVELEETSGAGVRVVA